MLLRFACSNFKSIKDRQEILFTAAKGVKGHEDSLIDVPGSKLKALPVTAIYGPNASGKTSLLEALAFMCDVVLDSHTDWKPGAGIWRRHHRLDTACADEVSGFEVDFVHQDVRYQYGFTCTSERFEKEWLYAYPKKLKQVWIERGFEKENWFGSALSGEKEFLQRVTRIDSLALSACGVVNHKQLLSIYAFFRSMIDVIDPDCGPLRTLTIAGRVNESEFIQKFIQCADVGVSKFLIEIDVLGEASSTEETISTNHLENSVKKHQKPDGKKEVKAEISASFLHYGKDGKEYTFDPGDESRGTLRWVELAGPAFFALERGRVLAVDEIEASLHPRLCKTLIRLFMDKKTNPHGAQLIFTSHNTGLLSRGILRRDEIWLTEKDTEGASHYYPLSDFKIGDKEDVEELYLDGRVGAVPYVGGFDELFERKV
jgi:uncharacterized protein